MIVVAPLAGLILLWIVVRAWRSRGRPKPVSTPRNGTIDAMFPRYPGRAGGRLR